MQYFGYPYCKFTGIQYLINGTVSATTIQFCNDKPQNVSIKLKYSIDSASKLVNNQFCSLGINYVAKLQITSTSIQTLTLNFDPVTLTADYVFPSLTSSGTYNLTVTVSDSRFKT